jgi:hypothetical protein
MGSERSRVGGACVVFDAGGCVVRAWCLIRVDVSCIQSEYGLWGVGCGVDVDVSCIESRFRVLGLGGRVVHPIQIHGIGYRVYCRGGCVVHQIQVVLDFV